jgi:hypothetical protein
MLRKLSSKFYCLHSKLYELFLKLKKNPEISYKKFQKMTLKKGT